jgi:hypothetical protein
VKIYFATAFESGWETTLNRAGGENRLISYFYAKAQKSFDIKKYIADAEKAEERQN